MPMNVRILPALRHPSSTRFLRAASGIREGEWRDAKTSEGLGAECATNHWPACMAGGVPGAATAVFAMVGGAASDRHGKEQGWDAVR